MLKQRKADKAENVTFMGTIEQSVRTTILGPLFLARYTHLAYLQSTPILPQANKPKILELKGLQCPFGWAI